MTTGRQVLNVKVGESLLDAAARAKMAMKAAMTGRPVSPYFGIGFAEVGQMLSTLTPRRWELIAVLREHGPMTVADLARRLHRNYKNVHTDCHQLAEWLVVERGDDGRLSVPWSDIIVDMKLPDKAAA